MALTLTLSAGLIGMVVDLGWAYWRREACATAANSAAFAAIAAASASGVAQSCGSGTGNWDCSAYTCPDPPPVTPVNNLGNGCLYAKQNGFLNTGRQSVSLTGSNGTSPVSGVTPAYWVTATATERIPTLFSSLLGQSWQQVSVNSVAAIFQGTTGGCVYVLNSTASGAYTQSGGNFATGCGVNVASSSSTALSISGGNLALTGGGSVYTAGDASTSSQSHITYTGGGSFHGGATTPGNPISGLTAPAPSLPCTPDPEYSGTSNFTIPSGTYCSITISGGSGIVLSGTYVLTSGNFTNSGGNITTASSGATLYFTPANTNGSLSYSGGNMTLTAPTSGTLSGFAIWKDGTTAASSSISGGNLTIGGIIYMPQTALTYSGGNTPVAQTLIVNTLTMSGGNITQPYNSPYFSSGATITGNFIVQ